MLDDIEGEERKMPLETDERKRINFDHTEKRFLLIGVLGGRIIVRMP